MSMIVYPDLVQGSEEWLAARCGILTASTIGKLITPTLKIADNETSRGLTMTLAAERLTGHVEYVHPSADMQRGTMDEPYARDLYADTHALVTEVGFVSNEFNGHILGASPDGLVARDAGIEIKSRAPKIQLKTILSAEVPAENLAQIHTCMLVTDRQWWDYTSYSGGLALYVIRVHRDPAWDAVIIAALTKFETDAAAMIALYNERTAGLPIAPRIDHFPEMELKL